MVAYAFSALAVVLGTALVLLFRLRQVTHQAIKLRSCLQAFAEGNLQTRAQFRTGPLLDVGDTFDTMAAEVARQLSQLEKSRLALEDLAGTDRLTGVGNRRAFDQTTELEVARSQRYGIPVSVILLDVDHFKRINDQYGHAMGDQCLIGIAQRIKSRLRDTDTVFRWGGEEFAIVTPCTPVSGASALAESLRTSIAEQPFPTVGHITASFGIAQLLPSETAHTWVTRADGYLYEAKHLGRNRVRVPTNAEDRLTPHILLWGDQFLTDYDQLNAEHAELFRLANNLILLHPESSLTEILRQFDHLLGELKHHFESEEVVLNTLGCKDLQKHTQEHNNLVAQALDLRERLIDGRVKISDVADFVIRRVAIGHLVNSDLPLFASALANNESPATQMQGPPERPSLRVRIQNALLRHDDANRQVKRQSGD